MFTPEHISNNASRQVNGKIAPIHGSENTGLLLFTPIKFPLTEQKKLIKMCLSLYIYRKKNVQPKREKHKKTALEHFSLRAAPTWLYGSETWTLTSNEERRIKNAEMRFLRRILGVSLREQIRMM